MLNPPLAFPSSTQNKAAPNACILVESGVRYIFALSHLESITLMILEITAALANGSYVGENI